MEDKQQQDDSFSGVAVGYPLQGESLADYQARIAKKIAAGETVTAADYREPTVEEMRAAIHDPTTPAPVKRFLREKLYGLGGAGRQSFQQNRLAQESSSIAENAKTMMLGTIQKKVGNIPIPVRPPGMSGRQWGKAKRLLRRASKAAMGITP